MITKAKSPTPAAAKVADAFLPIWQTMPLDTDECRERIAKLGKRITAYVDFMCHAAKSEAGSAESSDKAVTSFYERLLVVERQLARIHDDFRLE